MDLDYSYKVQKEKEEKIARAYGKELRISYRYAVEMCREIKGRRLSDAKKFLQDIIKMKRALPLRRYKKGVAHRSELQGWYAGRYPVKVAKAFLKILKNAEANAAYKGLDVNKLYILHAAAMKGIKIIKWIPRAFGRASPHVEQTVNLEIILEER